MTAIQIFDQLHAGIATVKDQQQTRVRWGGFGQPGEQVAFDGVLRRRSQRFPGIFKIDPGYGDGTTFQRSTTATGI